MDYKITGGEKNRRRFVQPFEALDIIPYSIALMMLCASLYIVTAFIQITYHS